MTFIVVPARQNNKLSLPVGKTGQKARSLLSSHVSLVRVFIVLNRRFGYSLAAVDLGASSIRPVSAGSRRHAINSDAPAGALAPPL
ncbi:hypothetical protein ABWW58_06400 [Sporolactobacillus sp. STCC-11]|uniref:hypothetical protein n=1 Tax=Sporolactobacillus caesalpiniae TaxID=3230362 RepID=UPI003390B977